MSRGCYEETTPVKFQLVPVEAVIGRHSTVVVYVDWICPAALTATGQRSFSGSALWNILWRFWDFFAPRYKCQDLPILLY